MKLKGLVWFFTIALILISLWELSYTWVVRNYESSVKATAERQVKKSSSGLPAETSVSARDERPADAGQDSGVHRPDRIMHFAQ